MTGSKTPRLGAPSSVEPARDTLPSIAEDARRRLSDADARLSHLLDEAQRIGKTAEQERAEMQRFLEEFALEGSVFDETGTSDQLSLRVDGFGPLFDLVALRRDLRELDETLTKAIALRSNLETAIQVVRTCCDQLDHDRAFTHVRESADVRIQQAMNSAREDERRRLAREVHDGPAQVLANAIFAIEITEQVSRRTPDQVPEELSRLKALLKDGVSEIRRFMFDLRPAMLEDHGLGPTVERYVDDYSRFFGKRVTLTMTSALPPLSADEELTIFRIVQEGLQNIHKHADSQVAWVDLRHDGNHLTLVIRDEGKGFQPDAVQSRPTGGAGLSGMRDRAKLIGATLEVVSALDVGTEVTLSFTIRPRTQTGLLRDDRLSVQDE